MSRQGCGQSRRTVSVRTTTGPGSIIAIIFNGGTSALFRLRLHAILITDRATPLPVASMNSKRSNKVEKERDSPERTAPPGEGWTAVGPGGDLHNPPNRNPPTETRRVEGTGPGRWSGTAEDLGTSGSRGSTGAEDELGRDEFDPDSLPSDGPGSRHSQLGRGQDTAR